MPSHSYTADLMRDLRLKPYVWFDAKTFEVYGRLAWRSRISEARLEFEALQLGTIENRLTYRHRKVVQSEYRFLPSREPQAQALTFSETQERC